MSAARTWSGRSLLSLDLEWPELSSDSFASSSPFAVRRRALPPRRRFARRRTPLPMGTGPATNAILTTESARHGAGSTTTTTSNRTKCAATAEEGPPATVAVAGLPRLRPLFRQSPSRTRLLVAPPPRVRSRTTASTPVCSLEGPIRSIQSQRVVHSGRTWLRP